MDTHDTFFTYNIAQGASNVRCSLCATVTADATKIVHRTDHRRGCSDDYGPGVASRRLDLNVPEETSRQLATVIAALRIETTRPPGWLRITIDNMEK